MSDEREKIIKAMAQAIGAPGLGVAQRALAAIAEQGFAVVPREPTREMVVAAVRQERADDTGWPKNIYDVMVSAADIARPDPAGEVQP